MKIALVSIFLLSGGVFTFLAALGIYRFPDTLSRLHAASKASSLGVGLVMLAVLVFFTAWQVKLQAFLIIFAVFLTLPISSHLIGRVVYFLSYRGQARMDVDELEENPETLEGG